MSEKKKSENVVHISAAKSFGNRVTKTLSTMSALSKVAKHRDTRTKEQGKGRLHIGRGKLSRPLPQMPLLDNHPSKGSGENRLAKTVMVDSIIRDLQITLEVHRANGITDVVPGLELAIEVIGDEYK